jgi:cytochrome bd-type quinol oxidase subunit 2
MLAAWRLVDERSGFLAALIVHGVLAGCFLTGTVSLLPALLPRERFSQLAAVSASLTALMVVVSTVALGACWTPWAAIIACCIWPGRWRQAAVWCCGAACSNAICTRSDG